MNPRVAGLVGNQGPQNKQPFIVAFFRATGVRLRSVRSAPGHKQRNQNRPKTPKHTPPSSQEALRLAEAAGSVFYGGLYKLNTLQYCWLCDDAKSFVDE